MSKGNIQHDVLQLMDKYPVDGIIETMVTLGATDEVYKWATKYFKSDPKAQAGDDLDKDLIRGILSEIEILKQKVARLEFSREPQTPQTTGEFPKEISKVFENLIFTVGENGKVKIKKGE